MSNREAKAALESGKIYVGDAPSADAARDVEAADVQIRPNAPRVRPWHDPVIVFRDQHLAVIAKPAGMLSVPAASRRGAASIISNARRLLGEIHAVHRLDEGTSGLMLVARTTACQEGLKQLFFHHDVERRYVALAHGDFPAEPVRRESELVRDRGDGLRGEGSDGKRAVSHFALRRAIRKGRSLIEATLETGRTHQIRIHLEALGFPILGDRLYAPRPVASAAARLALHAEVLGFRHPITDESLRFEAPIADDLARLVRELGKKRATRR